MVQKNTLKVTEPPSVTRLSPPVTPVSNLSQKRRKSKPQVNVKFDKATKESKDDEPEKQKDINAAQRTKSRVDVDRQSVSAIKPSSTTIQRPSNTGQQNSNLGRHHSNVGQYKSIEDYLDYTPKSTLGKVIFNHKNRLEASHLVSKAFRTRLGCSRFAGNVMAVVGFKMLFPTAASVLLTLCMEIRDWKSEWIAEGAKEFFWMMCLALVLYLVFYFHLRISHCFQKHRCGYGALCTIIFILCEICVLGIMTVLLPRFLMMMICITATSVAFITAYYSWTAEIEVRGPNYYCATFPLSFLLAGSTTITICYLLDRSVNPVNFDEMLLNFFVAGFSTTVIFFIMFFELQRCMKGFRMDLKESEWWVTGIILPLSFIYPSFLVRKIRPISRGKKVGPAPSTKHHPSTESTPKRSRGASVEVILPANRQKSTVTLPGKTSYSPNTQKNSTYVTGNSYAAPKEPSAETILPGSRRKSLPSSPRKTARLPDIRRNSTPLAGNSPKNPAPLTGNLPKNSALGAKSTADSRDVKSKSLSVKPLKGRP